MSAACHETDWLNGLAQLGAVLVGGVVGIALGYFLVVWWLDR